MCAIRESFLGGGGVPVAEDNVLGVLSLVFWSLVVVISIKYIGFVMRADNRGEGGILALASLISSPTGKKGHKRYWLLVATE